MNSSLECKDWRMSFRPAAYLIFCCLLVALGGDSSNRNGLRCYRQTRWRYRYTEIDFVDVVNEPLHERPVYAAALTDERSDSTEWVFASFRMARATLEILSKLELPIYITEFDLNISDDNRPALTWLRDHTANYFRN